MRLAEDKQVEEAMELLPAFKAQLGDELIAALIAHLHDSDDQAINEQRKRVVELKKRLAKISDPRAIHLLSLADHFVHHSVWIIGGDGWAYDIGYGGLDHVLASGKNVNALVLDTEVYSNTGGQASKATPLGAIAKFAAGGKATSKKMLGLMAMTYSHIYVAQVAMGANPLHTLKAIKEAEAFEGPSIILAYSHCIAHGIDMQKGMDIQKMAVDCGYWPLYRYNSDRIKQGLNPFQLDSKKQAIPLKDYVERETRFKALWQTNPKEAERFLAEAQEELNRRFSQYEKLAADK
jgi:pyruvate-ferredoxin/flavodoxin oxidoreductase